MLAELFLLFFGVGEVFALWRERCSKAGSNPRLLTDVIDDSSGTFLQLWHDLNA